MFLLFWALCAINIYQGVHPNQAFYLEQICDESVARYNLAQKVSEEMSSFVHCTYSVHYFIDQPQNCCFGQNDLQHCVICKCNLLGFHHSRQDSISYLCSKGAYHIPAELRIFFFVAQISF